MSWVNEQITQLQLKTDCLQRQVDRHERVIDIYSTMIDDIISDPGIALEIVKIHQNDIDQIDVA